MRVLYQNKKTVMPFIRLPNYRLVTCIKNYNNTRLLGIRCLGKDFIMVDMAVEKTNEKGFRTHISTTCNIRGGLTEKLPEIVSKVMKDKKVNKLVITKTKKKLKGPMDFEDEILI